MGLSRRWVWALSAAAILTLLGFLVYASIDAGRAPTYASPWGLMHSDDPSPRGPR